MQRNYEAMSEVDKVLLLDMSNGDKCLDDWTNHE